MEVDGGPVVSDPMLIIFHTKTIQHAFGRAKDVFDVNDDIEIFTCDELRSIHLSCNFLRGLSCFQLAQMFYRVLQEVLESKVLPSLLEKDDPQLLLAELIIKWAKYKRMQSLLSKILMPLDTFYFKTTGKLWLKDLAYEYFASLVVEVMLERFVDATVIMFKLESGNQINGDMLVKVIRFFREVENGTRKKHYYDCFEQTLVNEFARYYSNLSSEWVVQYSYVTYHQKVESCLNFEERRIRNHLHPSTVIKLLEVVRSVLLDEKAEKLIQMFRGF